jgi:hypothetical protein
MMKRFDIRVSLAVCLAAMIWGTVAHAETESTYVIGLGGHDSCGKFIAAIGDAPPGKYREMNVPNGVFVTEHTVHLEWLMGFVSGFNYRSGGDMEQQVTKIDSAGMDLWMRNWCNKHPTNSLFDGVQFFINEMLSNAAARR